MGGTEKSSDWLVYYIPVGLVVASWWWLMRELARGASWTDESPHLGNGTADTETDDNRMRMGGVDLLHILL